MSDEMGMADDIDRLRYDVAQLRQEMRDMAEVLDGLVSSRREAAARLRELSPTPL